MYMSERHQLTIHPQYSRLDRQSLIKAFGERFPSFTESRIVEMTRQQLIGLILEQDELLALGEDGGNLPEPTEPSRRNSSNRFDLPKSLEAGQSMYYCWEDKETVVDAAVSLAKGDVSTREWNLGYDVPEGSLLLTVLGTTPPLVTALESVTTVTEEKVYVEQIAVFSNPISLYDLETMIDSGLPRSSKALSLSTSKRVLKSLTKLIKNPQPLVIGAGQCDDDADIHANDAIHVLAMLQREDTDIPLCDGCGRDVDAKTSVHFFRPPGGNLSWDIQDHVDDAGLLCHNCHALMHGPTKARLHQIVSAPPCPECGEVNPRKALWGMPPGDPGDDYVVMGCVIPLGPIAEWFCRHCDTPYALVANPEEIIETYLTGPGSLSG